MASVSKVTKNSLYSVERDWRYYFQNNLSIYMNTPTCFCDTFPSSGRRQNKEIYNINSPLEYVKVKVKRSRYRPGVAQRVGRGIALLFHDRGTRRGWVVSSTPRPHFTSGKGPVPIVQEAAWAPGPVWTGGKSRPHRDSIPDRPARSSVAIPTELPGPHFIYVRC